MSSDVSISPTKSITSSEPFTSESSAQTSPPSAANATSATTPETTPAWVPEGSFSVTVEVLPASVTLTTKSAKEKITLGISSSHGLLGKLEILPNTFLPGCTIQIPQLSKSEHQKNENSTASLCDGSCHNRINAELATPSVRLELRGKCNPGGKSSQTFKNPLQLQLLGLDLKKVDLSVVCFAYRGDDSEEWSCLDDFSDQEAENSLRLYQTSTNHFTSVLTLYFLTSSLCFDIVSFKYFRGLVQQ